MGKQYGDIPRGIFVIRGENVILLGEVVCTPIKFFFLKIDLLKMILSTLLCLRESYLGSFLSPTHGIIILLVHEFKTLYTVAFYLW